MALRIKLARGGSAHNPVYRIVVGEARVKRDGKFVEWIGSYSPKAARGQLKIKLDRADYWMGVGAKPTDTVRSLINKARREPVEEDAVVTPAAPAEEVAVEAAAPVVEETTPVEEAPVAEAEAPAPAEMEAVVEEAPVVEEPAEETLEKVAEAAVGEEAPEAEEAEAEEEKKDA